MAQHTTDSKDPEQPLDIPFVAPHVLAHMEESHVRFKATPEHNPQFAYSLALPKAWAYSREFGPVSGDPFLPQGLGFFTGSVQPEAAVVAVTVTPMLFEIPIDSWIRTSFEVEGWQVRSAKWFPGALGLFFDIVGTRVLNDVPEVRRTSVRVEGGNVFSVNCLCGRKNWEAAKEIFWTAHLTFKLEVGTGMTRMEPWVPARSEHAPEFEMAHPTSWTAEPVESPPEDVSAIDVRLLDVNGEVLLAYLQARAERRSEGAPVAPVEARLADAMDRLKKAGLAVTSPPRRLTEDEDPRAAAVEGWLGGFVGQGRIGTSDVVTRVGFIERDGVAVTFSSMSPIPTDDPLAALRAERAFQIARSTFRFA